MSVTEGIVAADGSLVLKLYYKATTVTVKFDTGCDEEIEELTLTLDSLIEAPRKLSYGDLEFMGWYLGEELWDFETDTVTESITLSAKWGYKVMFILDDAESSILVEAGKTLRESDTPKKANALITWYISGTSEAWIYSTPITKAVTLVGDWIPVLDPDLTI